MAWVNPKAPAIVAKMPGVRKAVAAEGRAIAARARANLSAHRQPGQPRHTRISVESRSPDYLVHMTDPHGAVVAIEYGGTRSDGRVVQGLYILTNAMP